MTNQFEPQIVSSTQLDHLKKKGVIVVDLFEEQERELFMIRNPKQRFTPNPKIKKVRKSNWIYYPWRNTIVRVLVEADFSELRTARNRNLITKEEQKIISQTKVGISGLSVGNSITLTLALEGFNNFILADYDTLSVSNLNRLRSSLVDLGINKAILGARQIYELNPYAKVKVMTNGLKTEKDLNDFLKSLDVVIDETDDVGMRIKIRENAKEKRLPVVSAADNGYNAVVDIERFDLETKRPIYHGYLKGFDIENIAKMSFGEKFALINAMVGVNLVAKRMKDSLLEVGKSLYSWPQLGGAAMLSGASIAFVVKQIILGSKIKSGKYDVNLERIFFKAYDSGLNKNKRKKETSNFLKQQQKKFKR